MAGTSTCAHATILPPRIVKAAAASSPGASHFDPGRLPSRNTATATGYLTVIETICPPQGRLSCQSATWWRVFSREVVAGLALGLVLAALGAIRILTWQYFGLKDYGPHYFLIASTVGCSLIGVVLFGSLAGAMLPFLLRRLGFDPAVSSAPFVATLVDVTGLIIYFSIAYVILHGTLL